MSENIEKFDINGNRIYYKDSTDIQYWFEYDDDGRMTHYRNSFGVEIWYKYIGNDKQVEITQKEFEQIKEKEFLRRKEIPRFELMEL